MTLYSKKKLNLSRFFFQLFFCFQSGSFDHFLWVGHVSSWVKKTLFFSAASQSGLAWLNSSAFDAICESLLLIAAGMFLITCGGWFESPCMQVGVSLGFLKSLKLSSYRIMVTSRKSTRDRNGSKVIFSRKVSNSLYNCFLVLKSQYFWSYSRKTDFLLFTYIFQRTVTHSKIVGLT